MAKKKRAKKQGPAKAEPALAVPGYLEPSQTPHTIRARLIGPARWQITAKSKDYDPGQPESVIAAFESVGVVGPFCVFYKVESVPLAVLSKYAKELTTGRIPADSRPPRDKHFRLSEEAVLWDGVKANVTIAEVSHGRYTDFPGTFGTGVGRVEQWIALSRLAVHCLVQMRSSFPEFSQGFLWRNREVDHNSDLVLAVTSGPPILAVGENRDFQPESTYQPTLRTLSIAGQAVLVWAEATLRLRAMFNEVDVLTRAQMTATASLFERRKPVLDWTAEDETLLAEVRRELISFAPLWKKKPNVPAAPQQSITLPTTPPPSLTLDHERMLLYLAKPENRFRCLQVLDAAKPTTTRGRGKAGKLLADLERYRYVHKPHGPRKGYQITQPGLDAAKAIEELRKADTKPAQTQRRMGH